MKIKIYYKKAFAWIFFFISINVTSAQNIVVNPDLKFQEIEGWGSSLAWWANIVGGWPESELSALYHDITSAEELNMNIFKYNIPGGDSHTLHSPTTYSWYNTMYGYPSHFRWDSGDITSYKPNESSSYDWNANSNQRNVLQGLIALRDDEILEAINYSPPYWMTVSGCSGGYGGGLVSGQPSAVLENISLTRIPDYADFLTDIVKHYKDDLGITFKYISPLNEPSTDYWTYGGGQEGCKIGNGLQKELIKSLDEKIQSKGMAGYTSINVADDTSIDETYDNLKAYEADGGIMSKLGKIATHCYSGDKRSGVSDIAAANNLSVWQSEVGGGDSGYLDMSAKIILDLKKMHVSAWINWQIVSTHDNWGLYTLDTLGVGGLGGLKSHVLTKQKAYFGHKQFSKYIKKGYRIIHSTDNTSLSALDPTNTKLVVVVINKEADSVNKVIDLSKFASTSTATTAVVRTSPSENTATLSNMAIVDSKVTYLASPKSITTIVIPIAISSPPVALANGIYKIKAKHSGKYMSVNGFSSANNAKINQRTDNGADNFKFSIEKIGYDYTIKPIYNDKYFSIDGASSSNGTSVIQCSELGQDNQQFLIISDEGDYYKIISKDSYLCLAVSGESLVDSAEVVQWQDLDTDNFKWQFEFINDLSSN